MISRAKADRVRTIFMGATALIVPTMDAITTNSLIRHVFQDDMRVIGARLIIEVPIADASLNADGNIIAWADLSSTGEFTEDGALLMNGFAQAWTAAIGNLSDSVKECGVMFPSGHGVDFDDKEVIYVNAQLQNNTVAQLTLYCHAILFVVER